MKKEFHIINNKQGFTLLETLVAITILVVSIVGPMTMAARGLQSAFFAKEQITAFYLAQEAVEKIRAVRDENALNGNSWLSGLHVACTNGNGCGFDIRNDSFSDCVSAGHACRLLYDDSAMSGKRGFYTYTSGVESQYTRVIAIDEIEPGREAEVTVTVSWQSSLFPKTVTVQSRIFDQYDDI